VARGRRCIHAHISYLSLYLRKTKNKIAKKFIYSYFLFFPVKRKRETLEAGRKYVVMKLLAEVYAGLVVNINI